MTVTCDVYKSLKRDNLYLYVHHEAGLDHVPADLMAQFGAAELALTFDLHADRKLAKEDSQLVLKNLTENGYHLQLPPVERRV